MRKFLICLSLFAMTLVASAQDVYGIQEKILTFLSS